MWRCRAPPCCSHRAYIHKSGVSSSNSSWSLCSTPAPLCASPLAVAGTPRSWPPGCATASACSNSCLRSLQKCTSTPPPGRSTVRGWGRGPSASMKVGSSVCGGRLCTPADTGEKMSFKSGRLCDGRRKIPVMFSPKLRPSAVWHRGWGPACSTNPFGPAAWTWLSAELPAWTESGRKSQ